MKEYHKIQTVFLRDPSTKFKTLSIGQWAKPEFEYLKDTEWVWTEKVDGTNIRVIRNNGAVSFKGRSEKSQMSGDLASRLVELFPIKKLDEAFNPVAEICLYGEGYGNKIQKAGKFYNPDGVDFILFDVLIGPTEGRKIWLERHNIEMVADSLGIQVVPIVGYGTLGSAIQHTKNGYLSMLGDIHAEGLILKPKIELRDRLGQRIITKIKTKDFII